MKTPKIELFEILIAAGESRSLAEAAEKLKISQPAVSVKLKQLEEQAPLPLFCYEGRRKILTHYGRELYKIARANQVQVEGSFEELNRKYASAETLTLKVGSRRELFEALAPKLIFRGKVQFTSFSSEEAVTQLVSRKIDIAISYELPDSAEIVAKKVLESVSKFVVHRNLLQSKLTEAVVRDENFLVDTPCVSYLESGHLLHEWTNHLSIPFEKLKVRGIAEDWRSVQALVDQGWGYAIVPSYIESSSPDVRSILLPTNVLAKYQFYALFHKELKKVPAFQKILEFRN